MKAKDVMPSAGGARSDGTKSPGAAPLAKDIVISGLRKSFGGNEVLHGIDLTIPGGDFVGLMGPNGAGKSTLIKILDGVYGRSAGTVHYGEEAVKDFGSRRDVGFIHQDLGLVDELSISDNLRLGEQPTRRLGPIVDHARERKMAAQALLRVDLEIPVNTPVGVLSPGEKTLVAIARVLERGARVLFVDEATSTLPPRDSNRLIEALKLTSSAGATVIMVSHKLSEILDATSRVVLLLDGRIAEDSPAASLNRTALVSMLVSHEKMDASIDGLHKHNAHKRNGEELLRLDGVYGGRVTGIDLTLNAGEVVGLTGLPGSGLHDIAHLAHGTMKASKGKVVRKTGVRSALVPPNRETQGGFPDQGVLENLTISSLHRWRSPVRLLRGSPERQAVRAMIDRLSIKPSDPQAIFGTLSGGNKQKVIFGRGLMGGPSIFVLCEPTRGVDIGTRMEIYGLIDELAAEGGAIFLASSDSEDLFAVCDRIGVISDGKLSVTLKADETNSRELEAFI